MSIELTTPEWNTLTTTPLRSPMLLTGAYVEWLLYWDACQLDVASYAMLT